MEKHGKFIQATQPECRELMGRFVAEKPSLCFEDSADRKRF